KALRDSVALSSESVASADGVEENFRVSSTRSGPASGHRRRRSVRCHMSIFATKSIEQIEAEQIGPGEGTLKRVLGPAQLVSLGELVAWVVGWDLILEYALGAATVAVGWSGNLVTLLHQLGVTFPAAISAAPGTIVKVAGGDPITAVFNVPAVLITIAVTLLLIIGVSESATVNAVIVVIKLAVVLIVIGAGALFIDPANWHPFIPPHNGTFGEYGW